jgi:uncharacterized Ntn-hydrolase superfamily protein
MPDSIGVVAHTFSICAVDPRTGEAGVAVASRALAVGALVPYAAAGAGAIAIQGCVVPEYGKLGLPWLARGASAQDTLDRLLRRDLPTTRDDDAAANLLFTQEGMSVQGEDFYRDPAGRKVWRGERIRQVGVVDRHGRAAVHSGARLQAVAAARVGEGYACQGNALTGAAVVDEMARAYERAMAAGEPMDRALAAALAAGAAAGGDKRGNRAAALLVMRERGHWSGDDRHRDLRVDDDERPVERLLGILAQF